MMAGNEPHPSHIRCQSIDFLDAACGLEAVVPSAQVKQFKFIGDKHFHHKAGELRLVKHGTYVTVEGDVDGNGKADFQIDVHNLTDTLSILSRGDFIL